MQIMSEMIEENNNDVKIVSNSYDDSEIDYTERKPRSRERGPDKKPRTYRVNSMNNLAQFNQRPEAFTKYLKNEKGVDINGNSGIVKILLVFAGVVFAGLGGWWLYNHYKNKNNEDIENRY